MQFLVQKSAIFNISASYSVTYNAYMSGFDFFERKTTHITVIWYVLTFSMVKF